MAEGFGVELPVPASTSAAHAHRQYEQSTANLDARAAIHSFGTNPQSWAQFVRERLPLEKSGLRVLDVGAGTGLPWQQPLAFDGALVLADRHTAMCQRLQQLEHGRVLQCDAQALPFADSCVDVVTCLHVLYHVPEPGRAIAQMLRVLRPGGWLAVATNGPRHMAELDDLAEQAGLGRPQAPHRRFSITDAQRVLERAGLTPVLHLYDDELRLPEAEPALAYLRSLGGTLTPRAEAAVLELVRHAVDQRGHFVIGKETGLLLAQAGCS